MWKRQTVTAFLLQEAYSFFATNANPSLLWNFAAVSYDKINENIEAPAPKHAWQKHVLFFPVILHLSTLTTICLHAFHWLFLFKDRASPFQKSPKSIPENFIYFNSVSSVLVWLIVFLPKICHETESQKLLFKLKQVSEMGLNIKSTEGLKGAT